MPGHLLSTITPRPLSTHRGCTPAEDPPPTTAAAWRATDRDRRCRHSVMRVAAGIAVALLWMASPARGQSATLAGSVTDETQAPLSGATVELSSSRGRMTTRTGVSGRFTFDRLTPGIYDLGVTIVGFAQQRRTGVTVGNDSIEIAPFVLTLGAVSDTVVVTASRIATTVVDAPATMSVIDNATIASAPSRSYADLLRNLPGVNVIQMSARDVNITPRQAASTLANSQLVLLDGRPVNLDFFGMVLWDYMPNNVGDIKHIEVIRGPASAVWGASAVTGVVNVITKAPRETPGTEVEMGGGFLDRNAGSTAGSGAGGVFNSSVTVARVIDDRWAFRASAGYSASSAFARPVGSIPVIPDPRDVTRTVGGAPYPLDRSGPVGTAFQNQGTRQPKFDLRLDQELRNGGRLTYSGGVAGTEGLIHSAVGPFQVEPGSLMSYAKLNYERQALSVSAFVNVLNAKAPNLLLADPRTNQPLRLDFSPRTFDVELRDLRAVGTKQVFSYGGNLRRNVFDLTIAPGAKNRTEAGGYLEDTIIFGRALLTAGIRIDKFGNLDHPVYSPRLALTIKPTTEQALRLSFNRAFRSPSVVENYLDASALLPVDLSALQPLLPVELRPALAEPFPLAIRAVGSEIQAGALAKSPVMEERATAIELAYTGTVRDRTTLGASVYLTTLKGTVNLTLLPFDADPYTVSNPPPGWPLPPAVLGVLAAQGLYLPRTALRYSNLGAYREKGVELSIDHRVSRSLTTFANYSWQARPHALASDNPFPLESLQLPPANRMNAGFNMDGSKYLGSASVSYAGRAFWSDVLTPAYHGYSEAYTLVNAVGGLKWRQGRVTTLARVTNVLNQSIQQHVFGDILKRTVTFEVRLKY